MPASKYRFVDLKVGDWVFFPGLDEAGHQRLYLAARNFAHRNGRKLRVRQGNREGRPGSWVQRLERDTPVRRQQASAPLPGEVANDRRTRFPQIGEAHYKGESWIPMAYEPDSREMSAAVRSMDAAIRHYELKHGVRIRTEPMLRRDEDGHAGFGFRVTCVKAPETV